MRCVCSRRSARVAVMKVTDLGKCYDLARFRRLNDSRLWRILVQGQVRSVIGIVTEIVSNDPTQMILAQHDHMIEAVAP